MSGDGIRSGTVANVAIRRDARGAAFRRQLASEPCPIQPKNRSELAPISSGNSQANQKDARMSSGTKPSALKDGATNNPDEKSETFIE